MKTLHVLDASLPHMAGYTSRARSIVQNQKRLGIEPLVVTGLRQPGLPEGSESIEGVMHYRTSPSRTTRSVAGVPALRELAEMSALFARILDVGHHAGPLDVIHAHSPVLCGMPAHGAASRLGAASVYEVRAFWEDAAVNNGRDAEGSPRYAAIRGLETRLARSVDALVVICDGIRRELLDRGVPGDRIFTVPNGVDASRFVPTPRDAALAAKLGLEGKKVIGFIGTFFAFEGLHLLADAIERITAERDDVRGLIVGYGEVEEPLRRQHARLNLGEKLVLAGKVPASEVMRYYSLADVLCYPRVQQRITDLTTPLKPLEAMSMQKAVLGSDVGGIRELVRDGETGLLFRAGDVEDLVRAATRLLDDADLRLRLGEAARRDILQNRDWSRLARRYLDVYDAALAHRHARLRGVEAPRRAA